MLECRSKVGHTPLHRAAYCGHRQACELLLGAGANIEALTDKCFTPLHLAVFSGHAHIVQLLIEAGANSQARNNGNQTPLDIAKSRRVSTRTISVLATRGPDNGISNNEREGGTNGHQGNSRNDDDGFEVIISMLEHTREILTIVHGGE